MFGHYAGWGWAAGDASRRSRYREPDRAVRPTSTWRRSGGSPRARASTSSDVLAINVRTEVMFAAKARAAARPPGSARAWASAARSPCSRNASADGHTLIGQNWDWLLHSFDTCVVLEAQQDDGPDFVTVVEARPAGEDRDELQRHRARRPTRSSPTPTVAPPASRTTCCFAASSTRRRSPTRYACSSGLPFLLGQLPGRASRRHRRRRRGGARGTSRTCSWPSPSAACCCTRTTSARRGFDGRDVSLWVMPDSPFRLERFTTRRRCRAAALASRRSRAALADHVNYPSGRVLPPGRALDPHDQGATVASVLMDLDAAADVGRRRASVHEPLPRARLRGVPGEALAGGGGQAGVTIHAGFGLISCQRAPGGGAHRYRAVRGRDRSGRRGRGARLRVGLDERAPFRR